MNENEIHKMCEKYSIKNYTINGDKTIDVDGSIELMHNGLDKLPLHFNKVSGYFDCRYNRLSTLEGAPKYVGGNFHCSNNNLTSLKYGPVYVGAFYNCENNRLTSLEGAPEYVGNNLWCNYNNIFHLNNFNSNIGGNLILYNNPIIHLYVNYIKCMDNIEYFNEYRIVENNKIYLKRLMDFIKINDYAEAPISVLKIKGYEII